MILKTAYYISSTTSYSAMTEEAAFLSHGVTHQFGDAAVVTIELADPDGSIMRKYDVATDQVRVGPGAVEIWEPDATCVFMGRIIKARHNSKGNRVTLLCQDWMSQLGEERIKYDLREKIDGVNLRQSTVRTDIDGSVKKPVTRGLTAGVSKDASVYNDETSETNSDTVDDMTLLPAVGVADDGYLFGFSTATATSLTINVSTAGVGTWSISWYYSKGSDTWATLPGVVDSTIGFKTAGINTVTWSSAPGDWATDTFDGKTAYYVKGFINWVTVYTSAPKGAWAHGEYFMYDDHMKHSWAADDWNGKYVVFTNEMAGSVTVSTGPISENVSVTGDTMDTDTPTDGEEAVWDDDDTYHHMAGDGDSGTYTTYNVEYTFMQPIELSYLFLNGLTAARVKCSYSLEDAQEGVGYNPVILYDRDTYESYEIGKLEVDTSSDVAIRKAVWEIPKQLLDSVLKDDTGECSITLVVDVNPGTSAVLKVHKIRLEVDVDLQGYAGAVEIVDTVEEEGVSESFTLVDGAVSYKINNLTGAETWATETTEARDATIDDMKLEQAVAFTRSFYYFGTSSSAKNGLKINVSTLSSSDEFMVFGQWQYSQGSGVWKDLLNVVDGSQNFRNSGASVISWSKPDAWATDTVNSVGPYYWVRVLIMDPFSISVSQHTLGAQAWFMGTGSNITTKLQVGTDLTHEGAGVGIYEGCPYCIVDPISNHINGLVTGGDDLMTLTTDVESTTGISTRFYDDRTRHEVIQDLAKMDKAVVYTPLGTKQVKYKSTFNGSTTNLTDSDVLSWNGGEYDYVPMFNEFHVGGIRIGNNELYTETELLSTDPGSDSKTKYGATRTKVISSTGTMTQHDTEELGKALVEANEDVNLFLECVIAGLSTIRLGDEINVTSAYLGLTDEKYVVTHFAYNSKAWRTKLTLQPRTSQGFVDRTPFGEHLRRIGEQSRESMIDTFIPDMPLSHRRVPD